jgi:hypothetical protein
MLHGVLTHKKRDLELGTPFSQGFILKNYLNEKFLESPEMAR